MFQTIDEKLKGAKTYLTSGVGLVLIAYLQTKGIDSVGFLDIISDATVQIAAVWAAAASIFRAAMPDKRG